MFELQALEDDGLLSDDNDSDSESMASGSSSAADFNYIMTMALWCLTKEKKEQLLKDRDDKAEQLYQLRKKSPKFLWKEDLDEFITKLNVCSIQIYLSIHYETAIVVIVTICRWCFIWACYAILYT